MANYYLIVVRPFGERRIGDCISDDNAMRAAEADHAAHVVRVLHADGAPAEEKGA